MKLHTAIALSFVGTLLVADPARAQSATTTRVSVDSAGVEGNGVSRYPSISGDGRFVAFLALATNLVDGDANGASDVFVHDRQSGVTECVSISSAGAQGNSFSGYASLSNEGRFVAFQSSASNLVAGDTNSWADVFVRDRQGGTTERASINSAGLQGNAPSLLPSISLDGRFVAFNSSASNLVVGDTNGARDTFVRDRTGATTTRASVATGGIEGNSYSLYASVSANGKFVAFVSAASNLVAGDTNAITDVFVRDIQNGATERVSVSTGGAQADGPSESPVISADGRFVAFHSSATNLVQADTNGFGDVFVYDRTTATTERVSVDDSGVQGDGSSGEFGISISADGRYVAFSSEAASLVAGDVNGSSDIFLRDRTRGTTELVSVDSDGSEGDSFSRYPSISADGRYVSFESLASNLVAGDTNGLLDVFVRDRGPQRLTVYCTSSISSSGCSARIAANANPSATLMNPCNITVTNVEGVKTGMVFYGIDNAGFLPGPWAPGSTSLLCVKHPTQRTPLQNSGGAFGACNGVLVLDWNAYQSSHPLALGTPWSIGDKIYAQAWFRDPLAAKSTNLSNAIDMTYVP